MSGQVKRCQQIGGIVGVVLGALVAICVVWALNELQYLDLPGMWAAIFLLCTVAVIPPAFEVWNKQFDWLDLKNVFVVFLVLQFGMWPALVYAFGYTHTFGLPITFLESRYESFLRGEYYAILGLICFYIGRYVGLPLNVGCVARQRVIPEHGFPLLIISLSMIAIGIIGFVGLTASGGGLFEYVTHIDEFRTTSLLGVGYLMFMIVIVQTASLALITFYFAHGRYGLVAHLALALVLILAILGGIRHVALSAIVGYLIARHYLHKPIKINLSFVLMVIVFSVLNIFYSFYRGLGLEVFDYVRDVDWVWAMYMLIGRFHGAETIARVIDITSSEGFQYGKLFLLELFTGVIPRALWPGKPESSGLVANTTFFYEIFSGGETGSAVITLLGELYWIWGVPAIIIGMYGLGVWFRWLYGTVRSRDVESIGLYAIAFAFALFVNESLSLHLFQFLFKCFIWLGLFGLVKVLTGSVRAGIPVPSQ